MAIEISGEIKGQNKCCIRIETSGRVHCEHSQRRIVENNACYISKDGGSYEDLEKKCIK